MNHGRLVIQPKSLLILLFIAAMIVIGLSSFAPLPEQVHAIQNTAQDVQLSGSVQLKPIHTTAPPQTGVKLVGNIQVQAVYGVITQTRTPVDSVLLLDGSNAMNWTWDGKGTYTPGVSDPALAQYVTNGDELSCIALLAKPTGCQPTEAYKDYTQRQIYWAKQGIKQFLDTQEWGPQDRVAVVTFNGGNADPSTLTAVYPQTGLTSDRAGLSDQVISQAASLYPNSTDPKALYTTSGGSPGALGFKRAQQVFDDGASSESSEGRARTLVVLSNGLMNVYLNGQQNPDGTIAANYDKTGNKDLPINQAIKQSNAIKLRTNPQSAKIAVIGLGRSFDRTGLDRMASKTVPPFLTSVGDQRAMQQAVNELIQALASPINTSCVPHQEPDRVPAADRTYRYTNGGFTNEIDPATGQPSLGKVTVKQNNTLVATANISTDGTFAIPNLQPNADYTLSFNNPLDEQPVFYQGLDQPEPQFRSYSIVQDIGSSQLVVHINDASVNTTQFVHADNSPVILLLNGADVCQQAAGAARPANDVTSPSDPAPLPQAPELLTPTATSVGESGACQVAEEDAVVPPANKMFRLVNTAYIAETTGDGQPRLGVVTVRDAGGTVVAHVDIDVDGTWSVPHLQPDTSYTLSFNRPDDDPVLYQGSDDVFRNYSIVASTGSDQLVVQTISGGTQSLANPVVLVTSDDCVYTVPSQPDATPTAASTSTIIPNTSTSTATDTPNPSATATSATATVEVTGTSYKSYIAIVMRQ